jgi:hypothetical protein
MRGYKINLCRRVFGNMMGDGDDDSASLDSDSDLILDGEAAASNIMDSDDEDDDDDDEELEVNDMAAESLKNRKSAKPPTAATAGNSDDDF